METRPLGSLRAAAYSGSASTAVRGLALLHADDVLEVGRHTVRRLLDRGRVVADDEHAGAAVRDRAERVAVSLLRDPVAVPLRARRGAGARCGYS